MRNGVRNGRGSQSFGRGNFKNQSSVCICPRCGYQIPHNQGVPCKSVLCPKCNIPLMRQSGGGSAAASVVPDKAASGPKSQPVKNDLPVVDAEVCIGCGTCIKACPMQAISFKDSVAWINPELCRNCRKCVSVCPVDAIH